MNTITPTKNPYINDASIRVQRRESAIDWIALERAVIQFERDEKKHMAMANRVSSSAREGMQHDT